MSDTRAETDEALDSLQGRVRRHGHRGPSRGREPRLPRPLRAAAPRPGVGRHRLARRRRQPHPQGHGPGRRDLLAGRAGEPAGPDRDRPRALLDGGREQPAERAAVPRQHRPLADRGRAQRQPDQRRGDPRRARGPRLDLPGHDGLRGVRAPAGAGARHARGAARRHVLARARRVVGGVPDRRRAGRGARSARLPPALARPARPGLGGRERDLRVRPDRRGLRARRRAGRDRDHPARAPALGAAAAARAGEAVRVRAHLLRAARTRCVFGSSVYQTRKQLGRELAREAPVVADMVVPVLDSGSVAALGYAEASRHPVRERADPQPLRAPHLHRARAVDPHVRRAREAQPDPRARRGQAPGGGRGLDRARHHALEARHAVPRRGRARGARPRVVAADHGAVLLRDRHADPQGADRREPQRRGDPPDDRRRQPLVPLARALRRIEAR